MRIEVVVIALLGCMASRAMAVDFYVSVAGADANPGILTRPFATLARSQRAARQASASGKPVTVNIRSGVYYLPEPLVFTPADSGTKQAPVVYQAYRNEKAVISGGSRLSLTWQPYKNGIMQAAVPAGFTTDQLFVNGKRQIMARYPNYDPNIAIFDGYAADAISPERVKRWANPAGGFIHALQAYQWGSLSYLITGKKPDGTLAYEGGWQINRASPMSSKYRYVENIFEELDAPGEWFLNSKTNTLYYYPPAGLDLPGATIEGVRIKSLVEFHGSDQRPVRFITLRGLIFRQAARTFMETREPLLRSDWCIYRGGAVFYDGAEDCTLDGCFLDQVGGNAVFVNDYNRRVTIRDCQIADAGASGVCFVGDRKAARVPQDWNDRSQTLATLDRTPGPKTDNYPADCLVDDCLIYRTGRFEKQTAPVDIDLSQDITVSHCSLYDAPRAGINIGDGCWGGHIIEYCDVFDTVRETGDHGSFNSWGRDRYWSLPGLDLNDDATWDANKALPFLDCTKPVIIRNNRFRCDHGWDIDLDDGSTNYHIYNNLCLNGGIKNREGFHRIVENNIMVNDGFHPHVWFKHSGDIVRHNIMWSDHYLPAGGMPATPWGKEMDYNLVYRPGLKAPIPAANMAAQSHRDEHSIEADAMFVDPAKGDYRVKPGSLALKLGFVNFPMDEFGVQDPKLKAIARTPELPDLSTPAPSAAGPVAMPVEYLWGARVRSIAGLDDRSAYGLPGESGVLVMNVPAGSLAARSGLQPGDVILGCEGKQVQGVESLLAMRDKAAGKALKLAAIRKQANVQVSMTGYPYVVTEFQAAPADFKLVPLIPADAVLPARSVVTRPQAMNDPVGVLTDGQLARSYGPVFSNGITGGAYKMDLGAVRSIARVNTFSFNQGGNRGRQRFVLYGSTAAADPGWSVGDTTKFAPIADVDTVPPPSDFTGTSIRNSGGVPLGSYRWLIWAVSPVTAIAGGENTAFQEFQVVPGG